MVLLDSLTVAGTELVSDTRRLGFDVQPRAASCSLALWDWCRQRCMGHTRDTACASEEPQERSETVGGSDTGLWVSIRGDPS